MNAVLEIKRNVLLAYGIYLPDEELDKCILFGNEKEGMVIRMKVQLRLKDWKITQGSAHIE